MNADWEKIFAAPRGPLRGYQALVDLIEQSIARGELRAGDRLPTQRDTARRLKLAIGTVTRAYSEMEHRGIVVGKVGNGTYVSSFADQRGFAAQIPGSSPIIDMTISRPPPQGAAVPFANALRVLSKRRDVIDVLGTEPPDGWLKHRVAAAKWLSRRVEGVSPGQIVMCNGVQHALSTIFTALAKAGDVVATEELNYPGVKLLSELHRLQLEGVAMDEEGMRADRLEQACRRGKIKFVLCCPTGHNPTTITMSAARRRALAALARKYDFLLIENDILGMMPLDPLPSLRSLAPRETIYVTGLSKVIATGLRVGFIVASTSLLQPLMSGVRSTTWLPPSLMLEIFSLWVDDGSIVEIMDWHRKEIAARQAMAKAALSGADLRFDPSCYHTWLSLPQNQPADEFVEQAHLRGVSLSPSDVYAIGAGSPPAAVRITLGAPNDRERLARGLAVVANLLGLAPAGP